MKGAKDAVTKQCSRGARATLIPAACLPHPSPWGAVG